MKKIVIIGAGTIGLHCAYFLKEDGYDVEVIESGSEHDEKGCSYGNCGFIVPSHFIPLASPQMLRSGLKMIFDRTGPLYLPLLRNFRHIPWFISFMLTSCHKTDNKSVRLLYQMNEESRKLYVQLNEISGNTSELTKNGLIMASATEKGFHEEIELTEIARKLGIKTQILDPQSLKRIEPETNFNLAGAVLYESDAHINPLKHMRWLKRYLKQQGVIFHYQTIANRIRTERNKMTGVETNNGTFSGDEYVMATGASSSQLAKTIGIRLPVLPGKGYSIDLPKPDLKLHIPIILTEARVAITPLSNTVRLGSGMEFNGKTGQLRLKRIQAVLDRTAEVFPTLPKMKAGELVVWEGLRPVTPDGIPMIGRIRKYENLMVATGHAMMGVSLGPITGKIINDLISGYKIDFDMQLLDPNRFQ